MLKLHFNKYGYLIEDDKFTPKVWKFPCGEVGVKLPDAALRSAAEGIEAAIECFFESNDDLFAMAQLVDALRQAKCEDIGLLMPYFPYARQDRRCHPGEGHALKVVAKFINDLDFFKVQVYDAHSTVLEALVDRLENVSQEVCAAGLPKFDFLIAPDAGAEKKIFKHEQVVDGTTQVLCASKVRAEGGKISGVRLNNLPPYGLFGNTACVVDDLCDGGATFIELGKHVREHYSLSNLSLYVTHGMFTKGVDELLKIYDTIYVHNLVNQSVADKVTII